LKELNLFERFIMKNSQYKNTWGLLFCIILFSFVTGFTSGQTRLLEYYHWQKKYSKVYDAHIDVVYHTIDTLQEKLDFYTLKAPKGKTPVLLYIHGGGWSKGTKDSMTAQIAHYLENNFAVVNINYRLYDKGLAPAAVIDSRCALAWIYENAEKYNFDVSKIVVSGSSAGGHLAMITGMLPAKSEFDKECGYTGELKVAAIVDFYGIADVKDILSGENRKGYAVHWVGDQPNKEQIADKVSPINYVRKGLPPTFIVHGDADPTVPYQHAVRMQKALSDAGVVNDFMTIPGGVHGKFTKEQNVEIYKRIDAFLEKILNIKMNSEE
jgi:acetyl esterase/lipase